MDGKPLATVDDLQARLAFEMTPEERREATGALTDLSDLARTYGSSAWASEASTPESVRNLILRAAARYMKNYEGYVQSRAGDETLIWSDQKGNAGAAYFTSDEKAALRGTAGLGSLYTAPMVAWGTAYADHDLGDIFVPTTTGYVFPWRRRGDVI